MVMEIGAKDVDSPAGRALAKKAALEGIVLLKNDRSILPMDGVFAFVCVCVCVCVCVYRTFLSLMFSYRSDKSSWRTGKEGRPNAKTAKLAFIGPAATMTQVCACVSHFPCPSHFLTQH